MRAGGRSSATCTTAHNNVSFRSPSHSGSLRPGYARAPRARLRSFRRRARSWRRRSRSCANSPAESIRQHSRWTAFARRSSGSPSARRSPSRSARIPTERLPEAVEVAIYYLVAEAITNVTKYAQATRTTIVVERLGDGNVAVTVEDDGIGGADPSNGTGLVGLTDRVEALGGRLGIESPRGRGTRLTATIPCCD